MHWAASVAPVAVESRHTSWCVLKEVITCTAAALLSSIPPQVLLGTTNELPRQYGSELRQLVAAMMQQDPAQRITMPQLLAHPDVAPRLAQLQAQGLVGVAAAQSSGSAQVSRGRC